jgi:hypothetical protein
MDLYCEFGGDLVLTPNGSVQTAIGWNWIRERIIRSIITNCAQQLSDGSFSPAGYIFHPTYGLGLGAMVSQVMTPAMLSQLESRIRSAILGDAAVDPSLQPQVVFSQPVPNAMEIFAGFRLLGGPPVSLGVAVA